MKLYSVALFAPLSSVSNIWFYWSGLCPRVAWDPIWCTITYWHRQADSKTDRLYVPRMHSIFFFIRR